MYWTLIKLIFLKDEKIQIEIHINSYNLHLMEHENNLVFTIRL